MPEEFEQEHLETILKEIARHLIKRVNIYLFGGAVMVYNNLKPSTKDIDILFDKEDDYTFFIAAAKEAGFIITHVPLEYSHFDMSIMLQNPKTEWRLDLFLNKVCKKFCFNLNVKKRSKLFKEINKLNIYFIAFEDIFLMKSLTRRQRDLEDMETILGFGLDFKVMLQEIENQKEHKWDVLERLFEFEEKFNLKLALPAELRQSYEKHQQEITDKLLRGQIRTMLDEGGSEKEIIEHFELTKKEWQKFKP